MSVDKGDSMLKITEEDRQWWLELAPTLWWKSAVNTSTPHAYIVLGPNNPLSKEDYVRIGAVIRTFGQPDKYGRKTNLYLEDPATGFKYWTEDPKVIDTDLINRAPIGQSYAEAEAQPTATGTFTKYDTLAYGYDELWENPEDVAENKFIAKLISDHFGWEAPYTLDIGCGTGLLLEIGSPISKKLYVGLDPSQGMLNQLAIKHGNVGKLIPKSFGETTDAELNGPFDLVIAMFAVGSYLTKADLERMPTLVKKGGLLIAMFYEEGYLPQYYQEGEQPPTLEEARAASKEMPGEMIKIGSFDTVVWRNR